MKVARDLAAILGSGQVWRGAGLAQVRAAATGHAALDAQLPGGGWPLGQLSEVLHARDGVGELSLALPLLARLTQAGAQVAMIAPPCIPYAPALAAAGLALSRLLVVDAGSEAEALWAAEQLLHARAAAVLLWAPRADTPSLRRLQLAAESGDGIVLSYRPASAESQFSPAALRLRVWREQGAPRAEILKARGGRSGLRVALMS